MRRAARTVPRSCRADEQPAERQRDRDARRRSRRPPARRRRRRTSPDDRQDVGEGEEQRRPDDPAARCPTPRTQAVVANARNRISSPNGATMRPGHERQREPDGRRRSAAAGSPGSPGRSPAGSSDDGDRRPRSPGSAQSAPPDHLARRPAGRALGRHRPPVERTGVDHEQADQPDVHDGLDDDRQERCARAVEGDPGEVSGTPTTMTARIETGTDAANTRNGDGPA